MLNFYVCVLVDGQWAEQLVICFDEADYNLTSDAKIRSIVFELFGISSYVIENAESSKGLWHL